MKRILTSFAFVAASLAFAQVSIASSEVTPQATLDISSINVNGATNGILIPRVSRLVADNMAKPANKTGKGKADAIVESTLIYIDNISGAAPTNYATNVDDEGFYYFKGGKWIKVNSSPTFVKSIRTDTRKSVVVDQLEDGSPTPAKDYYIIMAGEPTGLALPAPNKSKGRTICAYNPGNHVVTVKPDPKGPVQGVDASQVACFISNGERWFNSNGY